MINKESIISAFDDKATLLMWLKKVEEALKESVLTNVEVIKITDARSVIRFTFADNTSITTPEFTIIDEEILAKVGRALVLPDSPPSSIRIICVAGDTFGQNVTTDSIQLMLGIGAGLTNKNYTLEFKNLGLNRFNINTNGHIVGIRFFDCVYNGEYYNQLSLERAFDGTEPIKCNYFKVYSISHNSLYVKELNIPQINDFSYTSDIKTGDTLSSKIGKMYLIETDTIIEMDEINE